MFFTNYVVLLNLTTDPVFVWLVFDYRSGEVDGPCDDYRYINELEDHVHPFSRPYIDSKRQIPFPSMKEVLQGHKRSMADDQRPSSFRPSCLGLNEEYPHQEGATAENSSSKSNCQKGFLGQRHPFDIALLAEDFQFWRPEGLDVAYMMNCIKGSHMCLGPSLRARSLLEEDDFHYSFVKKRVNIQDSSQVDGTAEPVKKEHEVVKNEEGKKLSMDSTWMKSIFSFLEYISG